MDATFHSGGYTLACYLKRPASPYSDSPGLILCHGFPIGPIDARRSAGTFPQLIDRIAFEVGYTSMTFTFRGCGDSTGDFSLQGWIDDLRGAIDHLTNTAGVSKVVLVGTNTGGSIAICVGADEPPRAEGPDARSASARRAGSASTLARSRTIEWSACPRGTSNVC